uniref:flavodoxin FldB n=1 Tax=Ningiella ruwaisensis TaxID=2364274 RepID=UPI00109FEF22|nr:flavodoxin FldB [Ningiella ruwaisensis]
MTADKRIGIFYGSTTCYTEMAGEKIQAKLQQLTGQSIDMFDIKDTQLAKSADYDIIIYGISTWDFGELQEDWESSWDDISTLNLSGKTVALYGLGDQLGYADWFQDALGMLHDELILLGCDIIGYWPTEGYEYTASKGQTEDGEYFVGLSLDDENQFDLSDERIEKWCEQIVAEWQAS